MKEKYEEYGVRTARFRELHFEDSIEEKTKGLNFPLSLRRLIHREAEES